MQRFFFCEMFKTFQNCFIVHLRISASDLVEYLETSIKICVNVWKFWPLWLIFLENIWNFGITMKNSENRI